MLEICRFYGIIIAIYFADHNPPHFHARYGDDEVKIEIPGLSVLVGHLPPRLLKYVIKWANSHLEELNRNWELAQANTPIEHIEPLD